MELNALNESQQKSAYAAQLKAGFAALRFAGPLEREFRSDYEEASLPRGRMTGWVALVLLLIVAGVTVFVGSDSDASINRLRIGVMLPTLLVTLLVCYHPKLQRFYMPVVSMAIVLFGLTASYNAITAAMDGKGYLIASLVLILIYPCLSVGLLFRMVMTIAISLFAGFLSIGWYLGLEPNALFYSSAVLAAAAIMGLFASYNLEHAHRANFLETRLLNELAERDGLTGLYNRRSFDGHIERLWRQSRREGVPLAIIFVDIDFFKLYNDLYGHQAGDDCLKRVADSILRNAKRPFDFCARFGGEEFVLVLYGPPKEAAHSIPEQIRRDVAALSIAHTGSEVANNVTVSVGVAIAQPGVGRSLAGAIQAADEALYQAKAEGRNRVIMKDVDTTGIQTGNFRVSKIRKAG